MPTPPNGQWALKMFGESEPCFWHNRPTIELTGHPRTVRFSINFWCNQRAERASRQNWRQLVGISAYVDASRKFALIGNFWDTVDRGRKRA